MKAVIAATVSALSISICAQELPPLSKWTRENSSWTERPAEQSYFYTRCAALEFAFGIALESSAQDALSSMVLKKAEQFNDKAYATGALAGMTRDFMVGRLGEIAAIYLKRMRESKLTSNNYISDAIQRDLQICLADPGAIR